MYNRTGIITPIIGSIGITVISHGIPPAIQGCTHSGTGRPAAAAGNSGTTAGKAVRRLLRGKDERAHGLTMASHYDSRLAWKTCVHQQVQADRGKVSYAPGCV